MVVVQANARPTSYGNNFAEISSVNGLPSGDYLIRRADDAYTQPGLTPSANTVNCISSYKGIINYPTTHGTLLGRILVRANTTADLDAVHDYQRGVSISTTPRTFSNPNLPQAPKLTPALLDTSNISDPNQKALELTARLGLYNQPEIASDRYRVGSILGQAGIVNGQYVQPPGTNLTSAQSTALSAADSSVRSANNLRIQTNDWVLQTADTAGNFGTDYAGRYCRFTNFPHFGLFLELRKYLDIEPGMCRC